MDVSSWLPNLLGPLTLFIEGVAMKVPRRSKFNFVGFRVRDLEELEQTDIVTTDLVGDEDGRASIRATKVRASGDPKVTIESLIGHAKTTGTETVEVVLWTLADVEQRRIDAIVTATNATGSKGGTWSIRARTQRTTFSVLASGGTDLSADASPGLFAVILVDGDNVVLRFAGILGETMSFGWEARSQRQVPA